MVRYRSEVAVATEKSYTFRLNSPSPRDGSPSGSVSDRSSTMDSTIYKERIDSLFRDTVQSDRDKKDTVKLEEPTMEHLKSHFQKVLAEHRGISVSNPARTAAPVKGNESNDDPTRSQVSTRSRSFSEARSAVQAKIEKMFQDASRGAASESDTLASKTPAPPPPPPPQAKIAVPVSISNPKQNVPLPAIPNQNPFPLKPSVAPPPPPLSTLPQQQPLPTKAAPAQHQQTEFVLNKYDVDYLGSLTLQEKATNLDALQLPLKDLYIKYRHAKLNQLNVWRGSMEISGSGIKIKYYPDRRSTTAIEINNPFPTIAVWAAVKFVLRNEVNARGSLERRFAFLPLICDPENQEKQNLFHLLHSVDLEDLISPASHPPMFTCVMRKMGAPKILECHAFVCVNPEDAIVIAANLYQALLRNMKTDKNSSSSSKPKPQEETPKPESKLSPPENVYSSASSVSNWSDSSVSGIPVRPPRRKKTKGPGSIQDSENGITRRKSLRSSSRVKKNPQAIKPDLRRSMRSSSQRGRVKRSISERQLGSLLQETADGDILTKVAIPRSKSFMNVPQNYSIDELFEELKIKEGIRNVDDVLKMIVNRDRMSYNELEPTYKELLMKLALTLSKDEMFQRSKNIMRKQTYVPKTTKSSKSSKSTKVTDSEAEHSSSSRLGSVLRATKKSLSKWSLKSGSGYSVASKQNSLPQPKPTKIDISPPVLLPSEKPFASKTPLPLRPVGSKNIGRSMSRDQQIVSPAYDSDSCYSDKFYCSVKKANGAHESDCCDSESCNDSEKCYCSLQRVKTNGAPIYKINLDTDTDTANSRASSDDELTVLKNLQNNHKNRYNKAKHTGSLTSWTMLSGAESPMTAWKRNTANVTTRTSQNRGHFNTDNSAILRQKSLSSYLSDTSLDSDIVAMTAPSKKQSFNKNSELMRQKSSSSYLVPSETEVESVTTSSSSFVRGSTGASNATGRNTRSESAGYQSYDSSTGSGSTVKTLRSGHRFSNENLTIHSNSSSDKSHKSQGSRNGNKKVLMVSAIDPKGKIVYRGSSQGRGQAAVQAAGESGNLLAVKKTAEIAAMFSDLKLSQTTDIVLDSYSTAEESDLSMDDAYGSMNFDKKNKFSAALGNSLGYLP